MLGQYQIAELIGEGGMASVYRALQPSLGREVALKILSPDLASQTGLLERFQYEARTLAGLDHPNILPIFDFGSEAGLTYIATPLVKGGTLRASMPGSPMDRTAAWRILSLVGDALHHAHEAGVVHRDLKPSNVLIHHDGRVFLADFGLARQVIGGGPRQTRLGFAVGTAGFMAPEQAMGGIVDRRADVYALAVMVFEMLTGTPPYPGADAQELAMATVYAPIPSAQERNAALPREVDAVLSRALAKDPAERTATVRNLVVDLTSVLMSTAPFSPAFESEPPSVGPGVADRAPRGAPPSVTNTLEHMGLERLRATDGGIENSFFLSAFHAATEIAGDDRWLALLEAAGLSDLSQADPPGDQSRDTPPARLAALMTGLERVLGAQAPEALRRWGRLTTELEIANERFPNPRRVPWGAGQNRRLRDLLVSICSRLDAVRGEHLNQWKQLNDGRYWLVIHANPLLVGRSGGEGSCQFWTAAVDALLRYNGLANDWVVEEIECGMVNEAGDCVFSLRSVREL